ncbi:cell division cycle protein 20 homolog B [Pleuronectes platessa]|uniref:cell division cycle protein 20 homolog B n=1 Tax=Pleuronectes platessa TaxID=8262 RepID=UPI00232A086D|nr:cell division cycle protein 20 homolog B [Pleuronectes platessa]
MQPANQTESRGKEGGESPFIHCGGRVEVSSRNQVHVQPPMAARRTELPAPPSAPGRDDMRDMFRDSVGKRRHYPFQGQNEACYVSYKRFRRWIHCPRSGTEAPAVSTPLTTGRRQRERSFELDTVCQRLELDSPPAHHEAARGGLQGALQDFCSQGWMWRAAVEEPVSTQQTDADVRRCSLQPFTVLYKAPESPHGGSVMKLAAPSLLNDYYTNVLDCSCNGTVALALGSSVVLWNSETRALVGSLEPRPQAGRHQSVSSLCWSRDGRALCIGTRRGEVELWDVENKQNVRRLPSHLSVVGALSWQQQLLSSGSVLGRIHHLDPRAPAPLVGAAVQEEGICSLQWSPGDDWLASGSTDGLLRIWDRDIAGPTRTKQPLTTMKQPSAVKAMGWCPWQEKIIATGGGWKDGELRIWDTQSGTCVNSANTNSQICSLRWAEKKKCLVTGHGLPHHQVTCWSWGSASLHPVCQLTGHSGRVLHLASNPDSTQIYSAAADQCFRIWDL